MVWFLPASAAHSPIKSDSRLLRTLDAAISGTIVSEGLKSIIREERPNRNDSRSFPSEHTALAFSIATEQAEYEPDLQDTGMREPLQSDCGASNAITTTSKMWLRED